MNRFAALLLVSLCSGLATAAAPAAEGNEESTRLPLAELRSFADVFNQIRSSYVESTDDRELLESAIRGMLQGLDPHSSYLDESSFTDLQSHTTGEFGGLGLEVSMENGFVKVVSPIDDTPADRAGIQAGDLVIEIDNQPVKGMSLQQAVELMRGAIGTKVKLTIVRKRLAAPFEVNLKRDKITVASVKSEILEPGFGYIRIAQFQTRTGEDVENALAKLHAAGKPLLGVVLDMRNNPGGLLQASVAVADTFLDEGLIVYTEGRLANSHSRYMASDDVPADKTPMVVLINGGSASASEIVAGALQDHRRAVIMGTRSFGKGSVQTVLPIAQNRAIKLTTAKYFTPSGRSIQAQGIQPDIKVERARIEAYTPQPQISEANLYGHLEGDEGEGREATAEEAGEASLAARDNQLYEALNLLKGMQILSRSDKPAATAPAR